MPLLILAPMYHVTDTVFRQIVTSCGQPDLMITEFVNVDGLQSQGRSKLLPLLYKEATNVPLRAQIWGSDPDNYYKTAGQLAQAGFDGIDINMGCPDRTVVKNNNCSALIKPSNRFLASQIIKATQAGAGQLPVSVKTRLGFDKTDFSWHQFLLHHNLDMLTIHARTTKEMSKTQARWHEIAQIKNIALDVAPLTKIVGNGDISSTDQALTLCQQYNWDGAMIGRAILSNPYLFSSNRDWHQVSALEKIELYLRHLHLFKQTYPNGQRQFTPLKKFMKLYLNNFSQASTIRQQIASSNSVDEMINQLQISRYSLVRA